MAKSRVRKKNKQKKRSRHIPKSVSLKVKKRHFFRCAWCGTQLFDHHHIEPYNLGGEHTEDNLILLCPNCHRRAHNNQIPKHELIKRKSTHLKGDRITGGFQTLLSELKFLAGSNYYENVKHLIAYDLNPILTFINKNDTLLINASFFDENGRLIFWMCENTFWAPSDFHVNFSLNLLEIHKDEKLILRLSKNNNLMQVDCHTYCGKEFLEIKPDSLNYNNRLTATEGKTYDFHIGIWITSNEKITKDDFLIANNETSKKTGTAFTLKNNSIELDMRSIKNVGKINIT